MRTSLLIALLCSFFSFCGSRPSPPDCSLEMSGFKDVYDYPDTVVAGDIPLFLSQKRKELSKRDSLYSSLFGKNFFNRYREPNLSIGFTGEETYRFIAESDYNFSPICIRFNRREMIVKTCVEGELYDRYDDSLLTEKEKYDLRFMEKNAFADTSKFRPWKRRYFDSMVSSDPRLLSVNYFIQLYRKKIVDSTCVIGTRKIPLTEKQFCSLVKGLQATDFGQLPWKRKADISVMDDHTFYLEAHTPDKFKYLSCSISTEHPLSVREFCKKLVEMAGLDPKKIRL